MRDHESDGERAGRARPAPAHDEGTTGAELAKAAAAAASGRAGAVSPAGMLHLQRTAGNAGLTSVLGTDVEVQREMGGGEARQPLYPSYGEGEEEV